MKTTAAVLLLTVACSAPLFADEPTGTQEGANSVPPGTLTEESLGQSLNAIGLKPTKADKRYDFAFKTTIRDEEWKFSMSAVLSRNGESVWLMAWLDQIPARAVDVPRTSLLRLLAANDRMGNGKFFAYIPSNKRFVIQKVVKNENLTPRKLTAALQDLSVSVADEYPIWSVANWAPTSPAAPATISSKSSDQVPLPVNANQRPRTQTSEANSKFGERSVQ